MTGRTQIMEVLAGVPMFATLSDERRAELADVCRLRSYPRGQLVFGRDDPGDSLLVVAHGRIKVAVRSADGGELLLTVVPAGGVIGELSLVDGGTRSADAETLDESAVVVVPREAVVALVQSDAEVNAHMLRSLAASLRRLTDATADLVFLDLPRRVVKLLLDQPRTADGVVDLGLNQSELAHRVGATRQSVNGALRGFERRGWLTLRHGEIVLRDVGALTRFAGR